MDISTNIEAGQRYVVINNTITYNSIVYAVGDQFIGVNAVTTYTGSGGACEILQVNSSGVEIISPPSDVIYPEQLSFNSAAIEIIQSQNGTIFPNQLTLFSGGMEVNGTRKSNQPQIIESIN